jgi:hypothetical protein
MNIREEKLPPRNARQAPVKSVTGSPASAQISNSITKRIACSPEQRQTMISEAAYFVAEHRGFECGHELQDWVCAESQIDAAIARGELPHVYKL